MEQFGGQNIQDFVKVLLNNETCKGESSCCYCCDYVESSTAGTMFYKSFCTATSSKEISNKRMGKRYRVRQSTAWYFMLKVGKAMEIGRRWPLSDLVYVDELIVCGQEEDKQGWSYDSKKVKAIIRVEMSKKGGLKRVYTDYWSKSLESFFERHASKDTKVVADKCRDYVSLAKQYGITQIPIDSGKNFKEQHIIVHQIKSWVRSIPTDASKKHMKRYLDEFLFRLNRFQSKQTLFYRSVEKILEYVSMYRLKLIGKITI